MQRREFLGASLAVAAASIARANAQAKSEPQKTGAQPGETKLTVLVLGGTGFLGPALVEAARARGHTVTLFNRGKTKPGLFPDLEKLQGDRDPKKGDGLKALEGRKFDVVFDDCGYFPRHVQASAELLAKNGVGQYVYVSSISCYAKNDVEGQDETAELATMPDPTVETMGKQYEFYGPLKALCEKAAEAALPGKTTIVRPGYIVGPGDGTGRFNYWPARFERGGEVLVPGAPTDPIQVIDVRDLGEWMVRVAEHKTIGTFNACGPAQRLSWGETIEACKQAGGNKDARAHWVALAELERHKDEPPFNEAGFPIWAPFAGDSKGFHTWKNARAVQAGLTFRPILATAKDTLAWWKTVPDGDRAKHLDGPTAEQEAAMLKLLA